MKQLLVVLLLGCMGITMVGCGNTESAEVEAMSETKYLGQDIESHSLYPVSSRGFVGDTMPYFEGDTFNVFYLDDLRDGQQGYHPWSVMKTKDFTQLEDMGEVIPFGSTIESQDIALGTGSVIKDESGTYHAFYTGHNDTYSPKEAVMHATSSDMVNWSKKPEDTFTGNNYSQDDFRDPYVLYDEESKCYMMLVVTRKDNTGVIAKYTSKDLSHWEDKGVFFKNDMGNDSNLECPTLIKFNGVWYLSFSDQWPDRVVHYRICESINGEFKKPKNDTFDGNGFYAGRMETDGKRLFVVGWNGTKNNHSDSEEYNWAGNMVAHELKQDKHGNLSPVLNEKIAEELNNDLKLKPVNYTETVKCSEDDYTFSGKDYEVVVFDKILGSYLIQNTIKNFDANSMFGYAFNLNNENVGNLNIIFDCSNNKIEFYNTSKIFEENPQSKVDFDFTKCDELKVSVVISDGVVVVYVNDQVALTTRMYLSQGMDFGVFSINSAVDFENVKMYR